MNALASLEDGPFAPIGNLWGHYFDVAALNGLASYGHQGYRLTRAGRHSIAAWRTRIDPVRR